MQQRGQIFGVDVGGVKIFKMIPWAFGIYEFQLDHMDRELAEMCEAYGKVYGDQFFKNQPQLMQVVPVEKEIQATPSSCRWFRLKRRFRPPMRPCPMRRYHLLSKPENHSMYRIASVKKNRACSIIPVTVL
jgi:hypothetical protein